MSILKKTDYEKKSTRERYRIERSELYFHKKAGNTPYILFAIGAVTALYAFWGGGPLHYVAALLFVALGVWQFFYVRTAGVTAPEVDERVGVMREEIDLETDALNASDMEYDAFMQAEKYCVYGYADLPVKGEAALLRADAADDTARSSHVQFTCFILGEEALEAYSTVRSLLGDEKESTIMAWPYGQIRQLGFERIAKDCSLQPGSEEKETRKFPCLMVCSSNKRENRTYAICEDCRGDAEDFLARIREKIEKEKE